MNPHNPQQSITTETLQQCILLASSPPNDPLQHSKATALLNTVRTSPDAALHCLALLQVPQSDDRVIFFALSTLQSCLSFSEGEGVVFHVPNEGLRRQLREVVVGFVLQKHQHQHQQQQLSSTSTTAPMPMPTYLRTKVAVVLAKLVQRDMLTTWPTAVDDLIQVLGAEQPSSASLLHDVLFRFLSALVDETVTNEQDNEARGKEERVMNSKIKNVLRGYDAESDDASIIPAGAGMVVPKPEVTSTITHRIVRCIMLLFLQHCSSSGDGEVQNLAALALSTLSCYIGWIDVDLICNPDVLPILIHCMTAASQTTSPSTTAPPHGITNVSIPVAIQAANCISELVSKGMEESEKIQLLSRMQIIPALQHRLTTEGTKSNNHHDKIHTSETENEDDGDDEDEADLAMKMAEITCVMGVELLSYWDTTLLPQPPSSTHTNPPPLPLEASQLLTQLMPLFFHFFSHEDIDVVEEVLPLAVHLAGSLGKEFKQQGKNHNITAQKDNENSASATLFRPSVYLPALLQTTFAQMHYPPDFQYNYQDEDDAIQQHFRHFHMTKYFVKLLRVSPLETSLEFVCREVLGRLPAPLSSCSGTSLEAALRVVYCFSEGVKVGGRSGGAGAGVLGLGAFREAVVALFARCDEIVGTPSSNTNGQAPLHEQQHREVLMVYYDIVVRYAALFVQPLDNESESAKVAGLLPGILNAMSGPQGLQYPHPRVRSRSAYLLLKLVKALGERMRPFVETAVGGIQGILSNPSNFPMEPDDSLYLFETVGLLLGGTGLSDTDQQHYLTTVMAPHIYSMEETLRAPNLVRDPELYGSQLSLSISAIAYLSKGLGRNPPPGIKSLLMEAFGVSLKLLHALPNSPAVRKSILILCQRMILCLGAEVLPSMPSILEPLIQYCNQDDVLDVSHLLNQLCQKFSTQAIAAVEGALLPFLHKCHVLLAESEKNAVSGNNGQSLSGEIHGVGGEVPVLLPPHVETEQMAIRKLTYAFLLHVVQYQVSPVFLSQSNAPHVEMVLQTMYEGFAGVSVKRDPLMQKTCILFFRFLIEQWGRRDANATVTIPTSSGGANNEMVQTIYAGFVQFVFVTLVPGLFRVIASDGFNARDAMQARCLAEMGVLLASLKSTRGTEEFERCVVKDALNELQTRTDITAALVAALTGKEMEGCLKMIINAVKVKR